MKTRISLRSEAGLPRRARGARPAAAAELLKESAPPPTAAPEPVDAEEQAVVAAESLVVAEEALVVVAQPPAVAEEGPLAPDAQVTVVMADQVMATTPLQEEMAGPPTLEEVAFDSEAVEEVEVAPEPAVSALDVAPAAATLEAPDPPPAEAAPAESSPDPEEVARLAGLGRLLAKLRRWTRRRG